MEAQAITTKTKKPRARKSAIPEGDAVALLTFVMHSMRLPNKHRLSQALGMDNGYLCRVWYGEEGISDRLLMRCHLLTGAPIRRLMEIASIQTWRPPAHGAEAPPALRGEIMNLTRYYHAHGAMHPGAVSTKCFVRFEDVLAILDGKPVNLLEKAA